MSESDVSIVLSLGGAGLPVKLISLLRFYQQSKVRGSFADRHFVYENAGFTIYVDIRVISRCAVSSSFANVLNSMPDAAPTTPFLLLSATAPSLPCVKQSNVWKPCASRVRALSLL